MLGLFGKLKGKGYALENKKEIYFYKKLTVSVL